MSPLRSSSSRPINGLHGVRLRVGIDSEWRTGELMIEEGLERLREILGRIGDHL